MQLRDDYILNNDITPQISGKHSPDFVECTRYGISEVIDFLTWIFLTEVDGSTVITHTKGFPK